MNELLQKFARQVGFGSDKNGEIYTSALEHLPITEDLEKFAELIVRECVRYINVEYQRDFESKWREDLSNGVKKHFGVEE